MKGSEPMENERHYDLICLGGGGAGVLAALRAAELGKKVALVSKEPVGYGNTRLAVGMMACPGLLPQDRHADFVENMAESGEGLSEPALVEIIARDSRGAIRRMEDYGMTLWRDGDGRLGESVVATGGGHNRPRTVRNAGGGGALGAVLRAATWRYNISLYHETMALELLQGDESVGGVLNLDLQTGEFFSLLAPAVIIATGGCGAIYYPHTSNSNGAIGDGLALALQAGAVLWEMEQVQSLPFGVTHPQSMVGALLGESSTAGPAGRLLNGRGDVVLEKDIHKMTRAALVKTMMREITAGNAADHGGLLLDLSPNFALPYGEKLYRAIEASGIFKAARFAYGEKAYRWEEPWSVLPTMHYHMGGIQVNPRGETRLPGLFAAGEAQAGIHGGNRLGSVALSEIFTFGRLAGQSAAAYCSRAERPKDLAIEERTRYWEKLLSGQGDYQPQVLKKQLQTCMWDYCGPVRQEDGLLKALQELEEIAEKSRSLSINPERSFNRQLLEGAELQLMLPVARSIVLSALERRESRGAHLRLDYPEKNDREFLRHTAVRQGKDGSLTSSLDPLHPQDW